jgi:hypothetical protein
MSLQDKLELAEARFKQNLDDRTALEGVADAIALGISNLKQKIAEEKKPKLRHGDYGVYNKGKDGSRYLHISDGGTIRPIGSRKSFLDQSSQSSVYDIYGNIFDDLKALQEDVEYDKEYEFGRNGGLRLLLATDGNIHFRGDTGFWLKDAMPVARMIQRMEATMKRNAN